VVALLISLKLSLLRGSLRTSVNQRIGLAIGALFGLGATAAGAIALIALRAADARAAAVGVLALGSLLVLGWSVVPLLVTGVDETLDPARFALLPVPARRLAPGLLLAGLVGIPGIATSVIALATLVTWTRGAAPLLLALPAAVLGLLTCVLASRLLTTAAARLLAGRRSREVGAVVAALLLSSIGLLPSLLNHGSLDLSLSDLDGATEALGWSPLGLPWAAPGDAATGHLGRGLVRLLLAAVLLVLGVLAWAALLGRALTERAEGGTRARVGRSPLDRLPAGPVWAVAARSLRYWRRDPRYVMAAVSILVSGVVPVVAVSSGNGHAGIIAIGPYVGTFLGVVTANDVGYDGSAFSTHLLVGLPGRADRLGRAIGVLTWAAPLISIVAVGGALLSGRADLWPGALGAALGGLLSSLGTASVAGALVPYPVAEAGGNPFRSNAGWNGRAALAQFGVLGVSVAGALPGVVLLVVAALAWAPAAWIALAVGPAVGTGMLAAGVVIGGRLLDSRGPEVLAAVRRAQ